MQRIDILYNTKVMDKDLYEYYIALANNIQFLGSDNKKILFSSFQENEGKSTVAINVAKALADQGNKVLFLDVDTRKSSTASRFKFRGKIEGLTSYLSGLVNIENVIYETDVQNLNMIPAGQVPPNPTALLQNKHFDIMLVALEQYYDYIIVDSPPVGAVIDAAVVAKKCNGTILVVEYNKTKRKSVIKAKEQLESSGSKFLGVILNKVDTKSLNYGDYGHYGSYGNHGKK